MEKSTIELLLSKDNWFIITIVLIYIGFKIGIWLLENKKAKTKEELIDSQFHEMKDSLKVISEMAKNSTIKDKTLDSIERKLKIIYAQYGSELSKEAAMVIINNVYFTYAQMIANEIYELQKKGYAINIVNNRIVNTLQILNSEKMQELDLFLYRDKGLITFTTGKIIEPEKIIDIINNFSEKNGLLRAEIETAISIEAGIVIKRL
jgi:hypothetical protein